MKTRIFTFLVAFLATVGNAVWGQDYQVLTSGNTVKVDGDGPYYFTTNGQQIENGGIRIIDDSPTIHLKDVNIKAGGSAIIIENGANPTIIIEGENTITSSSDPTPAIRVGHIYGSATNVSLTIEGTGILNIVMSDNDGIAIGNCQVGGAIGPCGSVTINSATVQTNGRIGHFTGHAFRFGGNAIVIANDIAGFNYNDEDMRSGGLLYLNDDTPYVGQFHTPEEDPEFTLNSPLPEPYKIELRDGGVKLEIGEGQSLNEDQLIDQGGQIKGYKVTYTSPNDVPMTTEAALPATKFVNSKYNVEQWDANASVTEENTTYKHIATHWLKNGTEWVKVNTEVTESEPQYTTLSNIETKEYQAVWYLESKTISYNLNGGFTGSFNLWYPNIEKTTLFKAEEQTGDNLKTLAEVGLQLSTGDDGNGNTIVPGTPASDEGKFTTKLNLTSSASNAPTGLETTLTVETSSNELDISDDNEVSITFNGGDFTYDGKVKDNIGNIVSVKNASTQTPFTYGVHYTLKFTQNSNEEPLQDAGEYTVTVVAVEESQSLTGQKELSEKVTIKPATLTIKEVSDVEWTIGKTEQPNYKEATFTLETVYSVGDAKDDVSINKEASGFNGSPTDNTWQTIPGSYTVNYSGLELTGSRAENYTLNNVTTTTGKLIVSAEGTAEDPIDDEGDDPLISATGDWEKGTRKYDGKPHPLTQIEVKNGTETATISLDEVTITYSYKQTADAEETTPEAVKNAGSYTATFTFPENDYGYKGTGKVSLEITKADFKVTAEANNTISVVQNADISQLNAADYITITGVNDEKPNISGYLTPNAGVSTTEKNKTGIEDAFSFNNVKVENSDNCLLSNYNEIEYPQIKLIVGPITIDPDTDGSGDGDDEVIGGEDADGDGTFPTDGDIILLATGDAQVQNNVYDGNAHRLALLKIGKYTLAEKTDYIISYNSSDEPSLNEADLPFHAATYSADIKLNDNSAYELNDGSKEFTLNNVTIAQRPMLISFVKEVASVEDLNDITKLVQFEEMVGNRGLVDGEEPTVEAEDIKVKDLDNGLYQVTIPRESFKVSTNEAGNFYLSDYSVEVDFDGDGQGDADITDDNNDGTGEIGDNGSGDEEDITIEITVDPDNDDNQGGNWNDYPDYYNIYVDTCQGVWLERSTKVVREGNSVRIKVEIEEGTDTTNLELKFKRSLFGYWEDLTQFKTETPDEYLIKNIYTDIYVMAKGAVPTGIEDIDGVQAKVYSKDGSIYVQTPKQEQVLIISISGAIVKNEKQVGLQRYDGLQRGVYVVKVGKQVFKIRN